MKRTERCSGSLGLNSAISLLKVVLFTWAIERIARTAPIVLKDGWTTDGGQLPEVYITSRNYWRKSSIIHSIIALSPCTVLTTPSLTLHPSFPLPHECTSTRTTCASAPCTTTITFSLHYPSFLPSMENQ